MSFIAQYILALAVVGLMLFGLYSVVRALGRGRLVSSTDRRLVTVIESTALAQNTALHLVKAGNKYLLIGGGGGHVSNLAEISADQVEPWLDEQRALLRDQTRQFQTLAGFVKQLGRPKP